MTASLSSTRLVLPLALCALLGFASTARAQDSDPLTGCRVRYLDNVGIKDYDPDTKTGQLTGGVQFQCDGTWIFAEDVSWNETTVFAKGKLLVTQDGLRVNAERMEMNRQTRMGTFYNAYGTARLTDQPPQKSLFGGMEPEVMFRAEVIERIGPRRYRITNGMFSTCTQPTPRWVMTGSQGTIVLDDYALLKNATFRVKGVPVLYVPYLYYPLDKDDRATGLLIPTYSSSSVRGQGLSNAFFIAIDRSQDATIFHDLFTKTGQGLGGEYRYVAAPGSRGDARVYALFEKERLAPDGSLERPAHRAYEFRGTVNQALGGSFRLIGNANYFTDLATQQLYQQNVLDFGRRERNVTLQVNGQVARLGLSGVVARREIYTGLDRSSRFSQTPQVFVTLADKAIAGRPVYYGASGEVAHLATSIDSTRPDLDRTLWRFDGQGTVRASLSSLSFLSVRTGASWRLTRWLESLDPLTGLPVPVPINRSLLDLNASITGPVLAKVIDTPQNGYAERFKHLIEPRVSIRWLSPFDQLDRVILTDQVDRQVGGTTTLSYSLTNRVLARTRGAGGPAVREMLSVSIGQSYYSEELAAAFDPQYPTGSIGTFSPIQIQASFSPVNTLSSRFMMFVDSKTRSIQSLSLYGQVNRQHVDLVAGWSKRLFVAGLPGFDNPDLASHYLNASATLKTNDGRFGGSYGFNYDVLHRGFLQQRVVVYYNAQCCGVAVDFQTINVSQFLLSNAPADRRLAISFTLAGIGSFSYPMGGFGR